MPRYRCGLSRTNYNWCPDPDDDNDYVWRHGAWEVDNRDEPEIDEAALEEWEERRRERIARDNEY